MIEVSEDVLPGTVIGAVTASDLDSGDLGKISYFLDGRSATRGLFAVNQDTGQIIVQSSLDRETRVKLFWEDGKEVAHSKIAIVNRISTR